jgi:hypothetical protein
MMQQKNKYAQLVEDGFCLFPQVLDADMQRPCQPVGCIQARRWKS